jgi:hypothetical protein
LHQSPLCLGLASLPAVLSLPERLASGRGLGQRPKSGYWNRRKRLPQVRSAGAA